MAPAHVSDRYATTQDPRRGEITVRWLSEPSTSITHGNLRCCVILR